MTAVSSHHDVAIIGYGPTGATLAKLLGQAGLSVAVFEREAGVYPLPRAIHFDGEVMRVFQNAGLRAQVEAISRPGLKGMHFVDAQGETLLVRGGSALRGMHGCANNYYFHQPELEAVLRAGVAQHANVRVHLRHEVFAIEEQAHQARLRYENMADGTLAECTASYVLGCDGARSLTRRVMGATMEDLGLHQPWLVFDVLLKEGRGAQLPDHTQQICDPVRPMTYCNVLGARRRWEIMLMPGDDAQAMVRPENVWKLVERWVTPADAVLERAAVYTFHSVIARAWRSRPAENPAGGRLLLAGDSAHQTPPFLGQGMCAGIRDAANLAWKLVLVLRGQAQAALLDTYASERAPHVRAFIDLAVSLGAIIQATDPQAARERDRKFKSGAPETFTFPAPPLGPGLHAREGADAEGAGSAGAQAGDGGPVGRSFPQPVLPDGRLLDDAHRQRFVVLGEAAVLRGADAQTRARWAALGAAVIEEAGEEAGAWLAAQGARAVLLRPDRYIMGLADSGAALDNLSRRLPVPA